MSAITALINIMGRLAIIIVQQLFVVAMALAKALGSAIIALFNTWRDARKSPGSRKRSSPRQPNHKKNRRQQRSWR